MGKQVLLSAGHSNADPGACANGLTESAIAVELRNLVAGLLRSAGVDVVTDGVGSENQPLSQVIKMIAGKTLAIEIHCNAAANPSATGVECISLPGSKMIAKRLAAVTAGALGLKMRGDAGWIDQSQSARGKLAFVQNGGLILEVMFISNQADSAAYQSRKTVLARALAETINGVL